MLEKPKIICGKCGHESRSTRKWKCSECGAPYMVIIRFKLQDEILELARAT